MLLDIRWLTFLMPRRHHTARRHRAVGAVG
jgi:hypothetical protein